VLAARAWRAAPSDGYVGVSLHVPGVCHRGTPLTAGVRSACQPLLRRPPCQVRLCCCERKRAPARRAAYGSQQQGRRMARQRPGAPLQRATSRPRARAAGTARPARAARTPRARPPRRPPPACRDAAGLSRSLAPCPACPAACPAACNASHACACAWCPAAGAMALPLCCSEVRKATQKWPCRRPCTEPCIARRCPPPRTEQGEPHAVHWVSARSFGARPDSLHVRRADCRRRGSHKVTALAQRVEEQHLGAGRRRAASGLAAAGLASQSSRQSLEPVCSWTGWCERSERERYAQASARPTPARSAARWPKPLQGSLPQSPRQRAWAARVRLVPRRVRPEPAAAPESR